MLRVIRDITNITSKRIIVEVDWLGYNITSLNDNNEEEVEIWIQNDNEFEQLLNDSFFYPPDEGYNFDDMTINNDEIIDYINKGWSIRLRMSLDTWLAYEEGAS